MCLYACVRVCLNVGLMCMCECLYACVLFTRRITIQFSELFQHDLRYRCTENGHICLQSIHVAAICGEILSGCSTVPRRSWRV